MKCPHFMTPIQITLTLNTQFGKRVKVINELHDIGVSVPGACLSKLTIHKLYLSIQFRSSTLQPINLKSHNEL